jgi:DNA-binding CsgD family transcriptional regulator
VAVGRSAGDDAGLHGRTAELDRIGGFLDRVATRPAALLIQGPPGIGKTALWAAGVQQARHRGWWVLSCRPVQSEAPLSFSALGDLFEAVPEAALAGLPEPQRMALDVALLRAEPGPDPPDQRAVAVALLGVVRTLAESAPVLVGVDDLPWLDRSSAMALEYALRRLTSQPAGLLATVAPGDDAGPGASLGRRLPADWRESLDVGPLTLDALAAVLRDKGSVPGSWPDVVELYEASDGNPYLALELAAALGAGGGTRRAGQPLPVPESLQPLVQRRLQRLSVPGHDVALLVAASGQATVELVVTACGDDRLAWDGLDSAEEAGVLEVAGDRVRFTHPLLRSLHYASVTQRQRRRAHQLLADATGVTEERVRHLALAAAGPDEPLAAELSAAALVACRRGAAVAGAELADLAHDLTPPDQLEARAERLIRAGKMHLTAFDPSGARKRLESAIELTGPGAAHAAALHDLARVTSYSDGLFAARSLLVQALDEAPEGSAVKALVRRDLGFVMGIGTEGFTEETRQEFLAARDIAAQVGDRALLSQLTAFEALYEFVIGHGVRRDLIARALAERRAAQRAAAAQRVEMELRPRVLLSHVLRSADDLAGARELLTAEYTEATEQGAESDLPFLTMHLAALETWTGNLELAEQYASHGYRVAQATEAVTLMACMHSARAITWAFRGPLEQARSEAEAAIDAGLRCGVFYAVLIGSHALSLVELVSGNAAAARALLAAIIDQTTGRGMVDPGWMALRPVADYIEALIRLGELAEAEAMLAPVEERALRLDRIWALATSARCRALLMSARGDYPAASAALQRAFAAHERLEMPLEFARTHLAAGDVARRARRKVEAREHVEAARVTFTRLGAVPWAERAEAELARLGTIRSGGLDLTPAERRVAELVAAGRTNREAAGELYMGVRTLETHLSAVYRKLGVRSRSELARTWAERSGAD